MDEVLKLAKFTQKVGALQVPALWHHHQAKGDKECHILRAMPDTLRAWHIDLVLLLCTGDSEKDVNC